MLTTAHMFASKKKRDTRRNFVLTAESKTVASTSRCISSPCATHLGFALCLLRLAPLMPMSSTVPPCGHGACPSPLRRPVVCMWRQAQHDNNSSLKRIIRELPHGCEEHTRSLCRQRRLQDPARPRLVGLCPHLLMCHREVNGRLGCPPRVHPIKRVPAATSPATFAVLPRTLRLRQRCPPPLDHDANRDARCDAVPIASMVNHWQQHQLFHLSGGRVARNVICERV